MCVISTRGKGQAKRKRCRWPEKKLWGLVDCVVCGCFQPGSRGLQFLSWVVHCWCCRSFQSLHHHQWNSLSLLSVPLSVSTGNGQCTVCTIHPFYFPVYFFHTAKLSKAAFRILLNMKISLHHGCRFYFRYNRNRGNSLVIEYSYTKCDRLSWWDGAKQNNTHSCHLRKTRRERCGRKSYFSIINEYKSGAGETVYHMDLYRLKDEQEAINAGVKTACIRATSAWLNGPKKHPVFSARQYSLLFKIERR